MVENLPVPFDRRVWSEAKALRDIGYRVSVVSPTFPGSRWHESVEGIEIYRSPLTTQGAGLLGHVAEYALALPSLAALTLLANARRRVDVLHVANPPDFFFPLGQLFRRMGAAFVFDHHDAAPELYAAQTGGRTGLGDRVLRWSEHQTMRAADVVIATNESMRQLALRRGRVPPDRVFVVRSSVDSSRTYRVAPDPALRAGRQYLAVYVGVMGPQDGVDLLVRACRHVEDAMPGEVRFLAIGDGSERPAAQELARELSVGESIHFPGRLTDEEVRLALSTADVAIGPDPANGFNELCTMNKTLEYMAIGVPLATFDLPETRAIAADAALYARPNDVAELAQRVVEILRSPDRGASLARVGRERMAGELSWQHSASELARAYERAVASANRRRANPR